MMIECAASGDKTRRLPEFVSKVSTPLDFRNKKVVSLSLSTCSTATDAQTEKGFGR